MTLQSKLDAFKADIEAGKPPYNVPYSVIETMHRATAELIASGAAQRALKAGDKVPGFMLSDPEGNTVSSDDLLSKDRWLSASIVASGAPIAIWSFKRCRKRSRSSKNSAQALSRSRPRTR
jgi:hypothetical protein